MASTIVTSSLKVKITETINLNGRDRGSSNELTIDGINEIANRIVTTPSGSFTTLFNIVSASSNVSAGSYASGSLKYARITNKDDSNYIDLRVSSSLTSDFKVNPGGSFIITSVAMSGSTTGSAITATATGSTWHNVDGDMSLNNVSVEPNGADVDVEYFIAST